MTDAQSGDKRHRVLVRMCVCMSCARWGVGAGGSSMLLSRLQRDKRENVLLEAVEHWGLIRGDELREIVDGELGPQWQRRRIDHERSQRKESFAVYACSACSGGRGCGIVESRAKIQIKCCINKASVPSYAPSGTNTFDRFARCPSAPTPTPESYPCIDLFPSTVRIIRTRPDSPGPPPT